MTTESQIQELIELADELFNDAQRCADAKLWRAAVISAGGAVEAGLIATLARMEQPASARQPRHRDLLRLTLGQAAHEAISAGLLPTAHLERITDPLKSLEGEAGDAMSFLTATRNMLVHPGNYVTSDARPDLTNSAHMQTVYEVLRAITLVVFDHLTAALQPAAAVI